MSGRSIKDLMQSAHPDWDGEKPARPRRNTLVYNLTNGDTAYQLHNTVIALVNSTGRIAHLTTGGWNTLTTRQRLNWVLAHIQVVSPCVPRVYSHRGSLYYILWTYLGDKHVACVFEFENNMQINLVKGVWIPNTAEVRYYCGIAKAWRIRAQDIKP